MPMIGGFADGVTLEDISATINYHFVPTEAWGIRDTATVYAPLYYYATASTVISYPGYWDRPFIPTANADWLPSERAREPVAACVQRAQTDAEEREAARQRSVTLLRENLLPEQRECFDQRGYFLVTTPSGRTYRINLGITGNVVELDASGRTLAAYCIHPRETMPAQDVMLAQKLLLDTDEAAFLRIANRTAR